MREEFVVWYHSPDNNRAPGNTCLSACRLLDSERIHWTEASRIDSKGCGANMRVAPVGLVPGLSETQRAGAAQLQAALTHGHPTALAASDLTARAVFLLAQRRGTDGTGRHPAVVRVREPDQLPRAVARRPVDACAGTPRPRSSSPAAGTTASRRSTGSTAALREPSPETDPCLTTGDGWIAEEALATGTAVLPALPRRTRRRHCARAACTRGDSDSIAALTGALAGAHLGAGAWPGAWSDRIEYRNELLSLGALWDA